MPNFNRKSHGTDAASRLHDHCLWRKEGVALCRHPQPPRPLAGYFKPYTVAPGVDTVAVPDFDVDLLGHSYFAQAEALLHDIYDMMRHNQAPAQRQRIAAAFEADTAFWKIKK